MDSYPKPAIDSATLFRLMNDGSSVLEAQRKAEHQARMLAAGAEIRDMRLAQRATEGGEL